MCQNTNSGTPAFMFQGFLKIIPETDSCVEIQAEVNIVGYILRIDIDAAVAGLRQLLLIEGIGQIPGAE